MLAMHKLIFSQALVRAWGAPCTYQIRTSKEPSFEKSLNFKYESPANIVLKLEEFARLFPDRR